ncbi:hypothetical protein NKR19_g9022 [Coniochaeta hoffmannii]|uniref:Uncharacterized protein n=1 Tax=Coniochaeta hoffmannii TaxID=91930 RepID=A0AA38RLI7_9PEZI|nr:hypothetical protein NKR19_g9022 [Coniochaeta hoffmannii]
MSGNSNVGNSQVYEAGDQRNAPRSEQNQAERFHEGNTHAHSATDSKDQRSIANRLAAEEKKESQRDSGEQGLNKKDPTAPAIAHGNKPSRGAEIDKELQEEDEAILRKKGDALAGKKN